MENASKALLMAGGVLIALLVITLVVYFYSDIKEFMGISNKVEVSEQINEFNKQYDAYYRNNLYGSDILSIVNKVHDYNIKQANYQGYETLELQVTFKNNYKDYENNTIISKKIAYNAETLKQVIDNLQGEIDNYSEKVVVKGNTIAALSGYRTNELEDFLKRNGITSETRIEQIENDIAKYTSYKSVLSTIKGKKFKAEKFEYSKKNSRITKMVFTEN